MIRVSIYHQSLYALISGDQSRCQCQVPDDCILMYIEDKKWRIDRYIYMICKNTRREKLALC